MKIFQGWLKVFVVSGTLMQASMDGLKPALCLDFL
ncbi:hypothetical protein SVI_2703 [Shewanella violacea DSS12]|uniref:Uncharacterized protein n=1 Tax=Shewanella violacea (strain JCM 10179 / CIP 106290 / LMG 19151 / DSS12) TaxID=637905 RepID=D4ZLX5_SHEVD|nr:hypothetical protein SVI_2703 [Shewanella violacea DSS12]